MEETDDIIYVLYKKEHYTDLVEDGYYLHFDTYLKPDFVHGIRNLLSLPEAKRYINKTFFLNQEEITLVAYSKKYKKAVCSVNLRKITPNLWGVWSAFVSPLYRGKSIAPTVVRKAFELAKRKNAKKMMNIIAKSNVPAARAWGKLDGVFLSNSMFKCVKIGSIEHDSEEITVRKLRKGEEKLLFDVFELCVGRQWCSFMEINQENYLYRIHGPASVEKPSLLSRLAVRKRILVAGSRGELQGYAISRGIPFSRQKYALNLFVPISKDFDAVCKALLVKAFRPANYIRENKFSFIYIGKKETQEHLKNLGFEFKEFLVGYAN